MNLFPIFLRLPLQRLRASARGRVLVLFSALFSCSALSAADSHPCGFEADPQSRLACYDRAFPPQGNAAVPMPSPEAVLEKQRDEFGLPEAEVVKRDPERARPADLGGIEAAVARVSISPQGARVVYLDNGQAWRFLDVTTRGPLAVGDRVQIRRAAMGSFQLVTPGRVALRVRRMN
jgi:predicted Zn-dependent protease